MADTLTEILRAASRHPNSRVSKLIHTVEEEPTQKNIVLLLMELAEHAEYSTDFSVSLKYYLDLFERLGVCNDLVLNEAGLLLVNSSKIYSKRVDYVQSLVERQILTLSNANDELKKQKLEEQQSEDGPAPAEKAKRCRKRALEAPKDPYEIELAPKKIKKLTEEKRFAVQKSVLKAKSIFRNIEMEQHIHPAGWQLATICDFENEEDVDTKRNFKLFTYHVEHRYNTLVPDINFRLHFKVKDYMDELEEMEQDEACNTDRSWPPLSEEYVQKYLRLEDYVLQQDQKGSKSKATLSFREEEQNRVEKQPLAIAVNTEPANELQRDINVTANTKSDCLSANANSELEQSMLNSCAANTSSNLDSSLSNKTQKDLESSNINQTNDSGLGQSIYDETNNTLENSQLSCTLETSTTVENVNDSNLQEANTSLNPTESQAEKDLMLKTYDFNQSGNTDDTIENSRNSNITANKDNLNNSNEAETTTMPLNVSETRQENDSIIENNTTEKSTNLETTQESVGETTVETSQGVLESIVKQELEPELKQSNVYENKKDFALGEGPAESSATNSLTISKDDLNNIEDKNGSDLKLDVAQTKDKSTTQIQVHLPSADDEGVCLSDLEEHNCRLISPVINVTNILPGVKRKDVTIILDEELRQALEMRDGIMEHFGQEVYKVPVITEVKKQNLIFNILQLPEKIIRRKVLFKLGPDMDVFLQARSSKRCKTEPLVRAKRNAQLPCSITPSHSLCSDFCGFSCTDDEVMSCAEFYGFTEEEQSALMLKHIDRLSRDSGMGVEVNNLTPEKETLGIIFESRVKTEEAQSTKSILNQLRTEIRDVLTMELQEANATTAIESKKSETENNSELTEALTSLKNNNEVTENPENCTALLPTENSSTDKSQCVTNANNTQESQQSAVNSEPLPITESENKSNYIEANIEGSNKTTDLKTSDNKMACGESLSAEESKKSTKEILQENVDLVNNTVHFENHHGDMDSNDTNDNVILDLNTQGNKTKIQQWHEHLQPILAKSRERHHFDVYKLGTEIIDTVQNKKNSNDEILSDFATTFEPSCNYVATFHDIMDKKDKSYVSRYFLSTLLLANQSNIEISIGNKSSEEPSNWSDINLKLLSTKRHTVAIEDNIGMIDKKQNGRAKSLQENSKKIENKITNTPIAQGQVEEDEDEPLAKLRMMKKSSQKLKTSLKRGSSGNVTTFPCIAEKKSKEITTNSRHIELPNLIQNVQIITPPFAGAPPSSTINTPMMMPSTSRQAQKTNCNLSNVNINAAKILQPVKKVPKRNEDLDSGIFSIYEMSTSSLR